VTTMASFGSMWSIMSREMSSSGQIQKRISSWTRPPPRTPPPIFLLAKSTYMYSIKFNTVTPTRYTSQVYKSSYTEPLVHVHAIHIKIQ
jgi:hypothetical protein